MQTKKILRIGMALADVAILLTPLPAGPQSCALYYTQAASSGARMIQAWKSGILILIAPPTLGSIGVIVVLYRKRHQVRRTESDGEAEFSGDESRKRLVEEKTGRREDW
jgi:hypothetical protein